MGECSLYNHTAFTVAYSQQMDHKLSMHTDESQITINYCIGQLFDGGVVSFKGVRCK